jgi:predicted enzyme related to lactoylglutathione lyase
MIQHIHSFAIFVTDIERAKVFYRDTLGFPISKEGAFGAELFLEPPHLSIHPAIHPDAKTMVGRHTGVTLYVSGLVHFCGDLHAKGVRFISEPTQMAWGIMAMIADPEGNVMALWEDEVPSE